MPGWRTYNTTHQSLWVTIYTLGGVFKEDWGEVGPRSYRDWHSGNYAIGSYYKVRGEWPMLNTRFDTDTTKALNSPLRQVVLLGGDAGVYWSDPIVRTDNGLGVPIWVTIYTEPGEVKKDWGDVGAGASRDWASGEYSSGEVITVLAEWDSEVKLQTREGQAAPPQEKSSVKTSRMFGENGVAHLRLQSNGKDVVWVNLD